MNIKNLVSLIAVSCLCCSCAIPTGSYKKTYIKAVRKNASGEEIERLESIAKYKKRQHLISPEGPVKTQNFAKSHLYIVDEKDRVEVRHFTLNDLHKEIRYFDFFPIHNSSSWIALGVRSTFKKSHTDIDIVKFDKSGVLEVITINNCLVILENGNYERQWKKANNLLLFETQAGVLSFNLETGKLIEPSH